MSNFKRVKDAQALIEHYSDEHWWFDPDLDIEESMQVLLDMAKAVEDVIEYGLRPVHEQTLVDALAKLEHGVTDQDIAETTTPEPGR